MIKNFRATDQVIDRSSQAVDPVKSSIFKLHLPINTLTDLLSIIAMDIPNEEELQQKLLQRQYYNPDEIEDDEEEAEEVILKPFYKNLEQMRVGLKLGDKADVQLWLNGQSFQPFYDTLCEDFYEPERARHGGRMPTAPNFKEVRTALMAGEANSQRKYSQYRVDKSDWCGLDHGAYFLYHCTRENYERLHGILHGKKFSQDQAWYAVWQGLRYKNLKHPRTKDKQSKGQDGATPAGPVYAQDDVHANEDLEP